MKMCELLYELEVKYAVRICSISIEKVKIVEEGKTVEKEIRIQKISSLRDIFESAEEARVVGRKFGNEIKRPGADQPAISGYYIEEVVDQKTERLVGFLAGSHIFFFLNILKRPVPRRPRRAFATCIRRSRSHRLLTRHLISPT